MVAMKNMILENQKSQLKKNTSKIINILDVNFDFDVNFPTQISSNAIAESFEVNCLNLLLYWETARIYP